MVACVVDYFGQESDAGALRVHMAIAKPWAKVLVLNPVNGQPYEISQHVDCGRM